MRPPGSSHSFRGFLTSTTPPSTRSTPLIEVAIVISVLGILMSRCRAPFRVDPRQCAETRLNQCESNIVIIKNPRGEVMHPFILPHGVPDGHVDHVSVMDDALDSCLDFSGRPERSGLDRAQPCGIKALEKE